VHRRYWIVIGVVGVAVAAAGGAIAAGKLESPKQRSDAIVADAAGRLKVTPAALSDALRKALDDQVDADVAAGRLTQAQGDAIKKRIDSDQVPLVGSPGGGFGFGHGPGFGHPGFGPFGAGLAPAASYLGITAAELQSELAAGKSLAQIATAHGKTAEGLVDALVAAAKAKLDQAVADGHLTSAQEQKILGGLQTFFKSLVNRAWPSASGSGSQNGLRKGFGFGFHRRMPHWSGTPPARHAAFVPMSL
jgi:hypothetical protein